MRRTLLCLVVPFVATILSAGQSTSPSSECMEENHPRNLCHWSDEAGTPGRVCHLDVEAIDAKEACHFESEMAMDKGDHPPICISAAQQEHIQFESSKKRAFRVRRLVRLNERNEKGELCPAHPFRRHFEPAELKFEAEQDSDVVDTAPEGCMYKFEVQFNNVDKNAPKEEFDQKHSRYECRDPHIKIVNPASSSQ